LFPPWPGKGRAGFCWDGRSNIDRVEPTVRTVLSQIVTWVRQESAATQALIQALIAIGIAFQWWHWTDSQTGAVIGITAALLGMFVRSQVTPLIRPLDGGRPLIRDPNA
jgi:hypothetical protein